MEIKPVSFLGIFKKNRIPAQNYAGISLMPPDDTAEKKIMDSTQAMSIISANNAAEIRNNKTANKVGTPEDIKKATEAACIFAENMQGLIDETTMTIKNKASRMAIKTQNLRHDVLEQFMKGDEIAPDGTVLREITGDNTRKVMKEYNEDGVLTRKSEFRYGCLTNIQQGFKESADGTKEVAIIVDIADKNDYSCKEGYKKLPDGSEEVAKSINFVCGVSSYIEGYKKLPDGSEEVAKSMNYNLIHKNPIRYRENYKKSADRSEEVAKDLWLMNGELTRCKENYKKSADRSEEVAKEIYMQNGKPYYYLENYKRQNGTQECTGMEVDFTEDGTKFGIMSTGNL